MCSTIDNSYKLPLQSRGCDYQSKEIDTHQVFVESNKNATQVCLHSELDEAIELKDVDKEFSEDEFYEEGCLNKVHDFTNNMVPHNCRCVKLQTVNIKETTVITKHIKLDRLGVPSLTRRVLSVSHMSNDTIIKI